jgi:hypothetical protein
MNSRTSILLAAIGLILPSLNPSAHAFGGPPGGPFSNGSYFANDGTFSAVLRGENLTGTVQFSTTSGSGPRDAETTSLEGANNAGTLSLSQGTGGVGSTGVSTIYYAGGRDESNIAGTYLGNAQGSYNPQASSLTVNFQADMPGLGNQTITVSKAFTDTTTENGTTTETTVTFPSKTILYFDSFYMTGSAKCKASNAFPNQKFQGDGTVLIKYINFPATAGASPVFETKELGINVNGVRLSNTTSSFNTSEVTPPSFNEFSILEE